MAAKRLSGVISLVLLSLGVHCYPYHAVYKTGSAFKHPHYHQDQDHYSSHYPLPDKEDGDSDEWAAELQPAQAGSVRQPFYPGPFKQPTDNSPDSSPEEAAELIPVFSTAIQKTGSLRDPWPHAAKRVPAQWVDLRIRPLLHSNFQAGDIANVKSVYEHGNSLTESEEQRFPMTNHEGGVEGDFPVPVKVGPPKRPVSVEPSHADLEDRYGELFITRRFPAGTITHFRTGYELGKDEWRETHFVRYNPPKLVQYMPLLHGVRRAATPTG
ncbi:uncharacterized protein LOC105024315 [Esox lucius]|uniref:uncharacterized protein LOC105024315 n=1 Tax=Esox lucius TaxID=8010 RepID=UPI001476FC1F|nr:uncharacterized protein LOC105024315 [Esox lucius]